MTGYLDTSPGMPGRTALQHGTPTSWVAIDIAKDEHVVLAESPRGRRQFRIANRLEDVHAFIQFLRELPAPVRIGFEPTGVYHRPLAFRLVDAGFDVVLIASLACARSREAMFTSWDKNDPKDTQVLLELLKQGVTMRYVDPLVAGWHNIQEVSKTYWQVTLARTRVQHSLLTHFLPLYWPEFARFWRTSRSEAFCQMLHAFPTPSSIRATDCETFITAAALPAGRKVNKRASRRSTSSRAARSRCPPPSRVPR